MQKEEILYLERVNDVIKKKIIKDTENLEYYQEELKKSQMMTKTNSQWLKYGLKHL